VCTSLEFTQSLLLVIPFILAGFVHLAVIHNHLLAALEEVPLDCGVEVRGRRLLGKNKTVRGLVTVSAAVMFWTYVQTLVLHHFSVEASLISSGENRLSPALVGLTLGFAWVLGELPNSFIKRQLDIAPGTAAPGRLRIPFWVFDQIDSLIGVVVCALVFLKLSVCNVLFLFLLALTLHPIGDLFKVILRPRERQK
jgi:CDP-archaeol synthase